jgi:hypothetical protein
MPLLYSTWLKININTMRLLKFGNRGDLSLFRPTRYFRILEEQIISDDGDVREKAESKLVSCDVVGVLNDVGWRCEDCNGLDVCFETGEMDVNVRER